MSHKLHSPDGPKIPREPNEPRDYQARITPANLADMPSVLDSQQAADVLRMGVERVRAYTNAGVLHRLRYTRSYLYSAQELLRFMDAMSNSDGDGS
jgi:hypothetical protein